MISQKPIGVNFIIGSGTTYTGKPPSFNVVYLDPETMLPVIFETYAFDLDHANQYDEPKWFLKYNYTEEYGMKDLSPQSFWEVSQEIFYNETMAKEYRNHRYIGGPGVDKDSECNYECRVIFYCQTSSNDYDEWQFCQDKNKREFLSMEMIMSLESVIDHVWYKNV